MRKDIPPRGDWVRHHPLASRIAAELPRALLRLTFTTLREDIRARYRCGTNTASTAIRIARQRAA